MVFVQQVVFNSDKYTPVNGTYNLQSGINMLREIEQLVGDINRFQAYLCTLKCTIHNQAKRGL